MKASPIVPTDTAVRAAPGWPVTTSGGVATPPIRILTNAEANRAWVTIDMAYRLGLASTGVPAHQLVALWPYLAGEAAQIVYSALERTGQAHLLWLQAAKALGGMTSDGVPK